MTLLAGRYTLDVPLGDSDLGTVWNAHDDEGTPLVVVTLEQDAPEALNARFRAHAKVLLETPHANLVRAIAEGDENGPYLVLERLTGESLAARLEAGPALTVSRTVEILTSLADALAAVHAKGISHGDVEPGNVLLVGAPGQEVAKLIGFALNRASVRQELGVRMSVPSLGPAAYSAPEQARGDALDGPLADQASLAAIAYSALGGRPPHIARDVAALAAAIGSEKAPLLSLARRELAPFASTIDRALSSDPKKRFADMGAFSRALRTAGTMAKAIASTPIPLGARTAIGEPPAPALPRAATIPKPAAGLGAARAPSALKHKTTLMGVPKPGAIPPRIVGTSNRSTEELEIGDMLAAGPQEATREALKAALMPPPRAPSATSTPQPPPKAPSATSTPQPPPKAPSDLVPVHSTEELDVAELQAMAASPAPPAPPLTPPRDSAPELDSIELQSLPPPAPDGAPPPPPPHVAPPPPPPQVAAHAEDAPQPAVAAEPEPLVALSPSMERIVQASAASAPAAAPETAKPAPPKPPEPPKSDWKSAAKPELPKLAAPPPPAFDDDVPSLAPAPGLAPPDEDRPSLVGAGERPAWIVPASIAAAVLLAVVSWFGYRAMQPDPTDVVAGHTLTALPTTVPETTVPVTTVPVTTVPETTVPETTVPVPVTTVPVTTVPATTVPVTVVPPPETHVVPPPETRVAPPSTTTHPPSTTTRPPSTTTRPPSTTTRPPSTTTRPPTTGTRPPPSSTTRRPPPTTTTRPTVVSDPGF